MNPNLETFKDIFIFTSNYRPLDTYFPGAFFIRKGESEAACPASV
jgi:hypothetical protein